MKLRILFPYVLFLFSLVVIIISFLYSRNIYYANYEECINEIRNTYILGLCKETKDRFENNDIPYIIVNKPSVPSLDSFTIIYPQSQEYKVQKRDDYNSFSKQEQAFLLPLQSYLFHKKIMMDITKVDSIVLLDLHNKNLNVKIGANYLDNVNKVSKLSREDSSFYAIAQKLKPIILGHEQELTIEPYIVISYKDILYNSESNVFLPYIITCLLGIVILVFSIICIIWGRRLRKYALFAPLLGVKPEEVIPIEVVPKERPIRTQYLITPTIYLDVDRFRIVEFDGRKIDISEQMMKLMREFIHAPEKYLTYKEICVALWGEVDLNYNDRLSQLVKRLRKKLKIFPELNIDNKSRNGYQLIIKSLDKTPPNPPAPEPIRKEDE